MTLSVETDDATLPNWLVNAPLATLTIAVDGVPLAAAWLLTAYTLHGIAHFNSFHS